ncbi:MAG: hypothetical protein N3D73_02825 [Candidatus Diapherotrites archaeon]|nr:hypothetical protein [Candidatus Diapherotrites archaeon]
MMLQLTNSKFSKALFFILGFFYLLSNTIAYEFFGFESYSDDWYIQVYSGDTWRTVSRPYDYHIEEWYYFSNPYRVYYLGNYYYFEPGWYSYNYYWRYNPWNIAYYSYYPGTYYYVSGHWYYDPNWIYYPSYYYTYPYSVTYNVYTYTSYDNYVGSGIGYNYNYPQTSDCSDVKLVVDSISISEGETKKIIATINNQGYYNLEINNVYVTTGNPDIKALKVDYPDEVMGDGKGNLEITLKADDDTRNNTTYASLTISAQFKDGVICNKTSNFYIYANGSKEIFMKDDIENSISNNSGSATSYSYYIPKTGWEEITRQSEINYYNTIKNSNTQNQISQSLNFSPNTNITNSNINNNTNSDEQIVPPTTSSISLSFDNVTIKNGQSVTKYLIIKNFYKESFIVEDISIKTTKNITAQVEDFSNMVASGSTAYAKIKIRAAYIEEDSSIEDLTITVRGYFNNGFELSKDFTSTIYVIGEKDTQPRLTIVESVKIIDYGIISLTLENSGRKTAELYIRGENLNVSLDKIILEPKRTAERTFKIYNLQGSKGYIFYELYYDGQKIAEKVTYVEKVKTTNEGTNNQNTQGQTNETKRSIEVLEYENEVKLIDGKATLGLTVKNVSNDRKKFYLELVGNENIVAEEKEILLESNESQSLEIKIHEKEDLEINEYYTFLKITTDNDEVFKRIKIIKEKEAEIKSPLTTISAIAMSVITSNFFLGLIAIILLIILLMITSPKKEKESWQLINNINNNNSKS